MEQSPGIGHNSRKTKGKPDKIDAYVGKRLRIRRALLGLSQEKLAQAIGLTFQQVQKYERGMNRISSGRLYIFSLILGVPVTYFYSGLPRQDIIDCGFSDEIILDEFTIGATKAEEIEELIFEKDVFDFARSYALLKKEDPKSAKTLKTLLQNLTKGSKNT